MNLRQAVIGVHHHNCWGSLSTEPFPEIEMKESGPVIIEKNSRGLTLYAVWDVSFPKPEIFASYLESLKKYKMLKKIRIISKDERSALLKTIWKNKNSSYDIVFNNNCLYASPVTQENGYEIYSIIAEKPKEIKNLMGEFSTIGQIKVFKVGEYQKTPNSFTLTERQLSALQIALNNRYYSWPRKITLDELSQIAHQKRRAFQENLRKAEAKVLPNLIKNALFKEELVI